MWNSGGRIRNENGKGIGDVEEGEGTGTGTVEGEGGEVREDVRGEGEKMNI